MTTPIRQTHWRKLRELVSAELVFSDGALLSLLLVLATFSFWPDRRLAANCLHSDAPDYVLPALNFLQGRGFVMTVEGHHYLPGHVFGLSLLISPAYAIVGPHLGNGIYPIFLLGLGMVVLLYYLAKRLFDQRIAFVSCLFLLLADQLRWYSRIIASDGPPSIFFCLLAHLLLLIALQNPRASSWPWLLLGLVIGFGSLVRPDNVFIILPIGFFLLIAMLKGEPVLKGILLSISGIAFWFAIYLCGNYLYSGDVFRGTNHIRNSEVYDRIGGGASWRYILNPSFKESNLWRLLREAPYQWSSWPGTDTRTIRCFYLLADVFLAVGLAKIIIDSRTKNGSLHLPTWVFLWTVVLVGFSSCSFHILGSRLMLRTVPYLCILDGVGLVAFWDMAARLGSPLDTIRDRLRTRIHPRLWPCVSLLRLRTLFGGVMVAWGGYVFLYPYRDPWAWVPISAFMEHANRLIPEKDAVIISNCNPFYAEHFLVSNSARMLIPLDRLVNGADFYVQWKKPPHPEWINEDFPNKSRQGRSVMYKRMRLNGAQFAFPYTALDNPDVIEGALRTGRKVYFVGQRVFTDLDVVAVDLLSKHTDLQFIMDGFEPSYDIPAQFRPFLRDLFVMRVAQLNSLQIKLGLPPGMSRQIDELEKARKELETELPYH